MTLLDALPPLPGNGFRVRCIAPKFPSVQAFRIVLVALLMALPCAASAGPVIREEGAIYLEDLLKKPVKLAAVAEAPVYFKNDLERYLGTLKKGQLVELQAVGEHAYRVRGVAQQGQVVGWVAPKYLSALKREFLDDLKQNAARLAEVRALIARNEVAVNMTVEEVSQALGKPAKKTSRLDANGREEVWEFVRFERVPQEVSGYDRYGRVVTNVLYVKVPAGKLSVSFKNNLVSTLEQSEGTIARAAQVRIVSVPFSLVY